VERRGAAGDLIPRDARHGSRGKDFVPGERGRFGHVIVPHGMRRWRRRPDRHARIPAKRAF